MEAVWDGVTRSETLSEDAVRVRQRLSDAARNYDWPHVIAILSEHRELVNTTRPDGSSLYAPLHQAAHGGAPAEISKRCLAWALGEPCRTSGANGL
jgi:hypothetical protein